MLSLGLLVGFAVGYGVGSRGPGSDESSSDTAVSSQPQPQNQTAPTTGPAAKPYSEQAVTAPAVSESADRTASAPPVPADAPSSAPPAASRRVAPASGRIIVQSNPSRAGVTVNGQWRGRTPLTLDELPFGKYVVRVVQPGYAVSREDVSLSTADPSRTLSMRLQRQATAREGARSSRSTAPPPQARTPPAYSGSIYVDSRPQGARVFIDGRSVGVTPLTVPDVKIGSHVVRLELADHRHWSTTTRVTSGQEVRVTGSLERIR
jgi:hypothetical protein